MTNARTLEEMVTEYATAIARGDDPAAVLRVAIAEAVEAHPRAPPLRVWICWCPDCGHVDYAYDEKPTESGSDCPRCDTAKSEKKIAGPYELVRPRAGRR